MPVQRTSDDEPSRSAKRRYGTGNVFEKRTAWYGQWRVRDRLATRKLGPVRTPGSRDGLTKTMAEARLRKLMGEVALPPVAERITLSEAGEQLIRQLATRGRKVSHACRVPEPAWGPYRLPRRREADRADQQGRCRGVRPGLPRSGPIGQEHPQLRGRLHSIFDFALRKEWVVENPCRRSASMTCAPHVADERHRCPEARAATLGTDLPNHRTVMLEGAGHYIQEDAPEEIVAAIRDWQTPESQ